MYVRVQYIYVVCVYVYVCVLLEIGLRCAPDTLLLLAVDLSLYRLGLCSNGAATSAVDLCLYRLGLCSNRAATSAGCVSIQLLYTCTHENN